LHLFHLENFFGIKSLDKFVYSGADHHLIL
jgi:hypothetical protein